MKTRQKLCDNLFHFLGYRYKNQAHRIVQNYYLIHIDKMHCFRYKIEA